jgi:phage-related protein
VIGRHAMTQQDVVTGSDFQTQARRLALYALKNAEYGLEGIYKILYKNAIDKAKPIEFLGNALHDLRSFPLNARREAGHQLDQVQRGKEPDDWKPMSTVGAGVKEIRIKDASGAFRVIYLAKFADAIYVLHCFQKKTSKTSKTSKTDLDLAAKRYRELLKERTQ